MRALALLAAAAALPAVQDGVGLGAPAHAAAPPDGAAPAGRTSAPDKAKGGAKATPKAEGKAAAKPAAGPKAAAPKAAAPKAKDPAITAAPPPGFENLLKPQRTIVDVFVGDRRVGQAPAMFKPGALRFLKPAAVADMAGVRKASRKQVAGVLGGWLPSNVGRLCTARPGQPQRAAGCGELAPKVAGVIFDESNLRAYVFIAAAHAEASAAWRRKFLRTPQAGLSFLTQLDGAVVGQTRSERGDVDGSVHMLNLWAYRNFRFRLNSNSTLRAGAQVESAAAEWDWRGYAAAAGVLRSTGSFLLPQVTMYGAHAGTSIDTRIDLDQAFGSQLSVFLPRRSIVEIIRDGRVLSARFYPSGNQLLDTRSLPSGAYPVRLRIREVGGRVREETRFFTKSSNLPPSDQPLVFAEGGMMARVRTSGLPERSDVPYVNFGARFRVRDDFVLGGQVSGTDAEWAGEANLFFLTRIFRVSLSGVGTSRGDWGVGASVSANWKGVDLNLSGRYLSGQRSPGGVNPANPETFRFVGTRLVQLTGSLAYRFRDIDLIVTATMTDGVSTGLDWSLGPTVRVPVWQRGEHDLAFVASGVAGNREHQVLLKFVYRWSRPKVSLTADAGAQYAARDTSRDVNDVVQVGGRYQLPDLYGHRNSAAAFASRNHGRSSVGASLRSRGPFGRYSASAVRTFGRDSGGASYTGNFSTGVAVDRRGVAAGGRERAESAIIIRVRGAEPDATFKVFIDNQQRMTLRGSRTRPIFLQPYKTYRISLEKVVAGRERSFARLDSGVREVVLYPGTVRTLIWRIEKVYAVFGRVLVRGEPLANAEIKGAVGVAETDGQGYFQAELKEGVRRLRLTAGGRTCTVRLRRLRPRNGFVRLGNLTCR